MSDNSKSHIPTAPQPGQPPQPDHTPMMKLPEPQYPSMVMPQNPVVPGFENASENQPRPDCEGQVYYPPGPENSPVPPPPDGKARILIGIPMLSVTYEFLESFLKFWTSIMSSNPPYEVGYHFAYRKPVHMAEEYLVGIAQHNKCTHILLMDDDIYDITREDLDKLINADKDVIGGVMHASKFPHAMCVFRRYNRERKVTDMPSDNSIFRLYEVPCACTKCQMQLTHWDVRHCPGCGEPQDLMIQQADLIPFAFTLIKMSVFNKIKKPWFHCTSVYPTDSWFADRLIEAGMTEYGHMGIRLNHAGITDANKPHYIQIGMQKAQANKGVVNITPEEMERHQFLLHKKMKEVEFEQKAKPAFHAAGQPVANSEAVNRIDPTLVSHGR